MQSEEIKVKILIIDDEQDYCLLMKSYFEEKNYEVFLAFNLKEGLILLKEKSPDILFLDNNLPDGEGWYHADEISTTNPSLRINLITAYKHSNYNFNSYPNVKIWEKPISIGELDEQFIAKR